MNLKREGASCERAINPLLLARESKRVREFRGTHTRSREEEDGVAMEMEVEREESALQE